MIDFGSEIKKVVVIPTANTNIGGRDCTSHKLASRIYSYLEGLWNIYAWNLIV